MDRNVIALAKGVSVHDYLHKMVDAVKAGFQGQGFECVDFNTADRASYEALHGLVSEGRLRFLLAMNIALNTIYRNREWLKDETLFLYMLDHPYLVYPDTNNIAAAFNDVHISYFSPSHVRFAERTLPETKGLHWLPHGSSPRDGRTWEERDIPILFVGSLGVDRDPEAFRNAWRRYGKEKEAALNRITEICLANPHALLEDAAGSVLADRDDLDTMKLCAYMRQADLYLRSRFRWTCLAALSDTQGVHVCGRGWDALAERATKITFHGPTHIDDVHAMMGRSKICLNLFPAYYGSHERVFDASAAGCLTFTPRSAFFLAEFGEEALGFFETPEELAAILAEALCRGQDAERRARRANEIFLRGHTWQHRARRLLGILSGADDREGA